MFSTGQVIFIFVFVALFAAALVWAYRSDRTDDRKHYRGVWKILIAVVLILGTMTYILRLLRKI
ncbi:MAG: hypothetical protein MUC87_18735 [Bacteroidia bacterium]|jgi:heme/copper-type cytochrome/quinol oxidase subunit 2|nr:hypothetical protein [Bacteroidia bacterium]